MNLRQQMKSIESLKGAALREKFREVTGEETRSNNRAYLIKRIAAALQTSVATTAQPTPKKKSAPKATPKSEVRQAKARERDPRLPAPGTVLEREHEGKTVRVKVLDEGFEFRGKTYSSLSTIASEATGTTWNGFLFFRLTPYAKRIRKAA